MADDSTARRVPPLTQTPAPTQLGLIDQLKELQELKELASGNIPRELILAAAIVLLEVASSDQTVDKFERSIIESGLRGLFNISGETMNEIMGEAKNHLRNMRGSSSEAMILRNNLDPAARRAIGRLIDELIASHGEPQGFEVYLRNRFRAVMGLPEEIQQTSPPTQTK